MAALLGSFLTAAGMDWWGPWLVVTGQIMVQMEKLYLLFDYKGSENGRTRITFNIGFMNLYYPLAALVWQLVETNMSDKQTRQITTGLTPADTNESFSLLVLHLGSGSLRPEGSNLNSLCSGWSGSARNQSGFFFHWAHIVQISEVPAILLHTQQFVPILTC